MSNQQHMDGLPNNNSPAMQPNEMQYPQMGDQIPGFGGQEVQMDPAVDEHNQGSVPKTDNTSKGEGGSKPKDKRERLRSRACVACHTGKTRCSDSLPCQSCIKRGIANTCAYPDPNDTSEGNTPTTTHRRRSNHQNANNVNNNGNTAGPGPGQQVFSANPHVGRYFYDASGAQPTGSAPYPNGTAAVIGPAAAAAVAAAARRDGDAASSGRPAKKARYRNLTDSELATFSPQAGGSSTKPFKRGTFYIGDSAPVSIDHRLPLRLLLADEERVDFFVGDGLPP